MGHLLNGHHFLALEVLIVLNANIPVFALRLPMLAVFSRCTEAVWDFRTRYRYYSTDLRTLFIMVLISRMYSIYDVQ